MTPGTRFQKQCEGIVDAQFIIPPDLAHKAAQGG